MASNVSVLLQHLQTFCQNIFELDSFVVQNGIDINHPDVAIRRNELLSQSIVTDSETLRLLQCSCHTLDDLDKLITEFGFDPADPAVITRRQELEVSNLLECFVLVHHDTIGCKIF